MAEIKFIKYSGNMKSQHDSANDSIKLKSFLTANYELTDTLLGLLVGAGDAGETAHHHDSLYFRETEHVSTSGGVGDAGKPVVLAADGKFDPSLIKTTSIRHGDLSNLDNDDHIQYTLADGTRAFTGDQSMGGFKLTNLLDGSVASDAINFGQLEAVEAALETQIGAAISGLTWKASVFLISSDAELLAAAEGAVLADVLPFSDDDTPLLVEADIPVGARILSKEATPKLFKVYDDAGTKKLTMVGVEQPAEGHAWICKHDLPDSPGSQENLSIYFFDGSDVIKVADMDFALANGIDMGLLYTMMAQGVVDSPIVSTDSVSTAIGKLEKQANLDDQRMTDIEDVDAAQNAILETPIGQVMYVAKNGNDSTGSGSIGKPFLTVTAALAAITDNSSSKGYIIALQPGGYVEAAGLTLKPFVQIIGHSRAARLSVASGSIALNLGANESVSIQKIRIDSPLVITATNPNASTIAEFDFVRFSQAVTISSTGGDFTYDIKRSQFVGAPATLTTSGSCFGYGWKTQFRSIVHGSATPSGDQGFLNLNLCNTVVKVTVNAASLYLIQSYTEAVECQERALGAQEFKYTVDSINVAPVIVGSFFQTRLSAIQNIRYAPAVTGDWNVTPAEPKSALDELASRVRTIEGDGGKPSYLAGTGGITKGQLVYLSADNTILPYSDITVMRNVVGVAMNSGAAGSNIIVSGIDSLCTAVLTGASFGVEQYWTGSGFSSTAPSSVGDYVWMAGVAKNATDLVVEVQHLYVVTA